MDKDYIPNFRTAFDHFLVHTGGRAVIEEVEKKLRLDPSHVQPSKETLFRYGNTCCAAVFYVLTNMESRVSHFSLPIAALCDPPSTLLITPLPDTPSTALLACKDVQAQVF